MYGNLASKAIDYFNSHSIKTILTTVKHFHLGIESKQQRRQQQKPHEKTKRTQQCEIAAHI